MPARISWMQQELPHGCPPLHPSFQAECLVEADLRVTADNMLAIAMLVNAKISALAFAWFLEAGDAESWERWRQRYYEHAPEEELLRQADIMFDSLHFYNPLFRNQLPGIIEDLRQQAVRAARTYGPDLPLDMWEMEK